MNVTSSGPVLAWVPGDMLGLPVPAHFDALREGGEVFLTKAFRASGALGQDNAVARIARLEEVMVGATGRKALLDVVYEKPTSLPTELFVKFSRNIDNPASDRFRYMLDSEIRFAALSRIPDFPVAVPLCVFADYHGESGTGVLITERIAFGRGGIERQHRKCMDDETPEPLAHYVAIVTALARLAGMHKAGRLPRGFDAAFPFDLDAAISADPIAYDEQQLQKRVARFAVFAEKFPHLLPANIAAPAFTAKLAADVPAFLRHERAIKRYICKPDYIALCHWNANIDNAWFWRGADGQLVCGLIDWARVAQMPVALSLLGAFSSAEPEMWNAHLVDILKVFVAEFARCGGPALDVMELKAQLHLISALTGLAYLMDASAIIQAQMPDLAAIESRYDPRLRANETARVQLHMMTMFLNQWQTQDFGAVLDRALSLAPSG